MKINIYNLYTSWKTSGRIFKTATILAAVYIFYVLIGFFAFPVFLRANLQEEIFKSTQREASISKVNFNPFTFKFALHDITIQGKKGKKELFSAELLEINLELSSLFRRALVLKQLKIMSPGLDIDFYGQGKYNISDLLPPSGKTNSESKVYAVFPFLVQDIHIHNGTLKFHDTPRNQTHRIDDFNFVLPRISSLKDHHGDQVQPRLDFMVNGDPVNLNAKMLPFASSRETALQVDFSSINLPPYWGYCPFANRINLERGKLNGKLIFDFINTEQGIKIKLSGTSTLQNILLTADGEKILECAKVKMSLERYSPLARILQLKNISVDKTWIKITRDKENIFNWPEYISLPDKPQKENTEEEQSDSNSSSPGFKFSCREVSTPEIQIVFSDNSTSEKFKREFNLSTHFQNIGNTPGKSSQAKISLEKEGQEQLHVNASLDITEQKGNCSLDFSAIPVAEYASYFREFIPWELTSAELSGNTALYYNPMGKNNLKLSDGQLNLDRIKVKRPGQKAFLETDNILAKGINMDRTEKTVGLDSIIVQDGKLNIVQGQNGSLDLMTDIQHIDRPKKNSSEKNTTGDNWKIRIKNILLKQIKSRYQDLKTSQTAPVDLAVNRLELRELRLPAGKGMDFDFEGAINKKGSVDCSGNFDLSPFKAQIRGNVAEVDLVPAGAYLSDDIHLDIHTCLLDADFRAALDTQDELSLRSSLNGSVSSLELRDKQQNRLVQMEKMNVLGMNMSLAPNKLHISEIILHSPGLDLERNPRGELNLKKALGMTAPKDAVQKDAPPEKKKDFVFKDMELDKVQIKNGALFFKDKNISPYYETELKPIQARAQSLSRGMEKPGRISLNATKDKHARLVLNGKINLLSRPVYSDLKFSIQGMDMVSLTPYTQEYLAYPIQTGKLNWNGDFNIQNSTLKGSNLFLIEHLELGPKIKNTNASNAPVKLALALLQDSRGDLELNIPISGNLNDPQFSLGKTIFKAIIGLFGKIATAPFSLIGELFGGGEDVNRIPYNPGEYEIRTEAQKKLNNIATALKKRPRLRVSIQGQINRKLDTAAMFEKRIVRRLRMKKITADKESGDLQVKPDNVQAEKEKYSDYLERAYRLLKKEKSKSLPSAENLSLNDMQKYLQAEIPISWEDLEELAMDRARSVRAYIINQDPKLGKRIFLRQGNQKDITAEGKAEAVLSIQ
ncbi:MAG: DUF748 domain-containing protein [Thermodesulfobacteriota bacterium]